MEVSHDSCLLFLKLVWKKKIEWLVPNNTVQQSQVPAHFGWGCET